MRKHYLDYLRAISILLLFLIHTLMIWNNFGTKFYIWDGENTLLSTIIVAVNPWLMPLLFVIAGMCARYSLTKRSTRQFVKERVAKLLLPFIIGILLLVPFQTLIARKFFYGYQGSTLSHYFYFFTHFSDLSGYDGCFTPGHLWFILYLFIISLSGLPIMKYIPYERVAQRLHSMSTAAVILLFIPIWLMYYIGNFGGYSIGKYFLLYLIGYYLCSDESLLTSLLTHKKLIIGLFVLSDLALMIAFYQFSYYGDLLVNIVGWLGVLTCLLLGKGFINKEIPALEYCVKGSYAFYLLHQTILVALGYYALSTFDHLLVQILVIMLGSFLLTVLSYEVLRKIPCLKGCGIK